MFANPFPHNESVYPKVQAAAEKVGADGRRNFSFHRQTTHPLVSKKGAGMVPGWNASNDEITANGRHGCYVLFDRDGRIVFQGRLRFEEVEEAVERLIARKPLRPPGR